MVLKELEGPLGGKGMNVGTNGQCRCSTAVIACRYLLSSDNHKWLIYNQMREQACSALLEVEEKSKAPRSTTEGLAPEVVRGSRPGRTSGLLSSSTAVNLPPVLSSRLGSRLLF